MNARYTFCISVESGKITIDLRRIYDSNKERHISLNAYLCNILSTIGFNRLESAFLVFYNSNFYIYD